MNNNKRLLISMLTLLFCCTGMWAVGELNGVFTISASGGKVQFSQGNLQYQASTNTWRFATNQYDYIGNAAGNTSPSSTQSAWIDYFNWGTSGYNHGANRYEPWSTSTTRSDYYAYGSSSKNLYDAKDDNSMRGKADWGYNAISNGGNTENSGWRVLTKDEWAYLINTRSETYRYAKGTIHGTNGLMLFPDGFTLPTGVSISNANTAGASYTSYSDGDWTALEAAGVVFLPATGLRNGTSVPESEKGSVGNYWSSTYMNADCVYNIRFDGSSLNLENNGDRQNGFPVRLVKSNLKQDGSGNYLIGSVQDWKDFATLVQTTPTANAKMIADVNLGDDQTVIGGVYNGSTLFYQGTFDGQGHTLTIAYDVKSGDGERFTTPFSLLEGATIKNLHLDGTVNSTYAYGGSIASILKGTNTIENVWNSVTAVCTMGGWVQMGGFIGVLESGATATISDCLYTGSITHNGGYSGYFNGGYGPKPTVNNCLVLGAFTGEFGFNGNYDNCYCKHASTTGVTQPSDENLSNGTTTAELNNGRTGDAAPWVQDPVTNLPQLKLFASNVELTAKLGDNDGEYWATYYHQTASLTADASTTVYTGALGTGKVLLTEVNDKVIPAGNAVILKSTSSTITLTPTNASGTLAGNALRGTTTATAAPTNAYCLSKGTSGVGFYAFTGTIPANRGYLVITSIGNAPQYLGFDDNGGTTGVNEMRNQTEKVRGEFFDLQGRRILNPTKGLYIVNGRKVIIK
ncbi:MAG: hypothetical protein K6E67_01855 [Prevotella sp.]|nr:hypothetical protein [Prevotella sp.]